MIFHEHFRFAGKHAFLSASDYHWLRYSDEKLFSRLANQRKAQLGTELHAFAAKAISLGVRLPWSDTNDPLNTFVNDAIDYEMSTEVVLVYSQNCFGTADAISFKDSYLRVHDLKTGESCGSMEQLMIYAALFYLEYRLDPEDCTTELRLYNWKETAVYIPEPKDIRWVMDKIVYFDEKINEYIGKDGVL